MHIRLSSSILSTLSYTTLYVVVHIMQNSIRILLEYELVLALPPTLEYSLRLLRGDYSKELLG